MSIFKSIWSAIKRTFTAKNLDAAQAFVAKYLPEFGDELAAFSAGLAKERGSLLELADRAKDLWLSAKGTTISTSLATALAQSAFNAAEKAVLVEAEKLLAK
jgi:hypothetical protein